MLGDTPAVRATLAALMETGIRVSDVEIVRLTPGFTLDDRLQRFMETAARLGAGQVLVAGNDDNLQRSADNLAILAAAGRPFGLTMNLEPMPLDPVAQHRRSASTNRRQRAGRHRHSGGRSPFLARGRIARRPLQPARASSQLYATLRWRGAEAGERAGTYPPCPLGAQRAGEGGLDLHGLMSALPATLPVSLEVPLDGEQGALPPLQRAQLLFDAAQPYLRACA